MSATMPVQKERRQNNNKLVADLQQERKQVWSLYCKMGELKPFTSLSETKTMVTQFSQILIDYISLGHFGLYERLLTGNERRESILTAAKRIYPEFSKITDAVVSFNDKYDNQEKKFTIENLETDLSLLGEDLAKRIDLEDELCGYLGGSKA